MRKIVFCSLFIFLKTPILYAQNAVIRGNIRDQTSGETIIGAVVYLEEKSSVNGTTNLEGTYVLKNIPAGKYTLVAKSIGYEDFKMSVALSENESLIQHITLKEKGNELSEVVVKDKLDGESDVNARRTEQNADQLVNILSAKTIQLLPDITVANVLQRISGVSVERSSSGDGKYAIIRGMDQRYNYTLVNGIKIPSPDNKSRYLPMDIFPAELLERLEVVKSLTPNMEGDAIGGAMNMVMKKAPDRMLVSANLSTGYSQTFFNRAYQSYDINAVSYKSPLERGIPFAQQSDFSSQNMSLNNSRAPINGLAGLTLGNRFLGGKFGTIISASYQNTFRGTNSVFFPPAGNSSNFSNAPVLSDVLVRQLSVHQERYGIISNSDFKFNEKNRLTLFGMYTQMIDYQARYTVDTTTTVNRHGFGTGTVDQLYRTRTQNSQIYNATLRGDHTLLPRLSFNWTTAYSNASMQVPDWEETDIQHDVVHPGQTSFTYTVQPFKRIWMHNNDQDKSVFLNLVYNPKILGRNVEFTVGGMYRTKNRLNYYVEYDQNPMQPNGQPIPFNSLSSAYASATNSAFYDFVPTSAAVGNNITNNYTATENISGYYWMFKTNILAKLQAIGGVRYENTNYTWVTKYDPNTTSAAFGGMLYNNSLPSLHLKYSLNSRHNIRASYFKALNRPSFYEPVNYILVAAENFPEIGNPYIKPAFADNLDLRYEWFMNKGDQLLVGTFYKYIQDPIEIGFNKQGSDLYLQPQNFGNATNYGLELQVIKFWGNFGVSSNYTYTHSSITTPKSIFYRVADANGVVQTVETTVNQTRPLQGQAGNIGNISLLYKNQKIGLDIQIAGVYTGKRIIAVNNNYDNDYWQLPTFQLDFSAEKRVYKHFTVFTKLGNLLNTAYQGVVENQNNVYYTDPAQKLPYQYSASDILVQRDYYYQTYLLGIRYKPANL